MANLLADWIIFHPFERVEETNDANNRGKDQHVSVEAQPCEVDSNFDSEIIFDVVQWLGLPAFLKKQIKIKCCNCRSFFAVNHSP